MKTIIHQKLPTNWDQREKLRDKGQFWTPNWIADAMVAYVAQEVDIVFDPGVGKGVFYTALKKLDQKTKFYGTDIDPEIIEEAKVVLTKILNHFKENEKNIGKGLTEAFTETMNQSNIVGKCPSCGSDLKIMFSKKNKSYFIACSNYPNCKMTFSVPKYSLPKPSGKVCDVCAYPVINMIRKGKKPYEYCINPNCKKKEEWYNSHRNQSMYIIASCMLLTSTTFILLSLKYSCRLIVFWTSFVL